MAITYTIDSGRSLVITRACGDIRVNDLLRHKEALLRDGAFRPGFRELSDVRCAKRLDLGFPDMQLLAGFDQEHREALGSYRLALVVPASLSFGLARMYQQMTEGHFPQVGAFRCLQEAMEWLEIAEPAEALGLEP